MWISYGLLFTIFLIIIEIISVLFRLTGLPEDKARFQVISILTGTGFTTRESELITQHPTRRKLAQTVMILGYVGLAALISFLANIIQNKLTPKDAFILFCFTILIIIILKNRFILFKFDKAVEKIASIKKLNIVQNKNLYALYNQNDGYGLYDVLIEGNSRFVGKTLLESNLKNQHIQVINVDKGNFKVEFPSADYKIERGDKLLVYGKKNGISRAFDLK